MEGFNPSFGCTTGCKYIGIRRWVPKPRDVWPRRDALIDAIGRTDNPCERPARCGPCCEPLPKFRLPKELPECNPDCFPEEKMQAKQQEECEKYQKFVKCCCPPPVTPEMVIEPLDPEYPIAVELPEDTRPENVRIMKELPCRTNFLAGFFNPDDNKTPEQRLREQCDRTYLSCGPNLPLYPCRGSIDYPRRVWTTLAEEMNPCDHKFICEGTKFCDPKFMEQQKELQKQKEREFQMRKQQEAEEEEFKKKFFNPNQPHPCCANEKLSLTPYCNCGCDYFSFS